MKVHVHVHDSTGGFLSMAAKRRKAHRARRSMTAKGYPLVGDEGPGHQFHGNQWTGGIGGVHELAHGEKPSVSSVKGVLAGLKHLLSTGHEFTLRELMSATGATNEEYVRTAIHKMHKAGVLTITKHAGGRYSAETEGEAEPDAGAAEAEAAAEAQRKKQEEEARIKEEAAKHAAAKTEFHRLQAVAQEIGSKAKTEAEHYVASKAHEDAAKQARSIGLDMDAGYHERKATEHRNAAVVAGMGARRATVVKPIRSAGAKELEARFAKHTPEEINKHLEDKYGLKFLNQGSDRKLKALQIAQRKNYWTMTAEERLQAETAIHAERDRVRASPGSRVRSHSPVDIDEGTSGKSQRKILGHIDNALATLEATGYDVKAAISSGKVTTLAGSPGKALGHAWQARHEGVGYMAFSPKGIDPAKIAEYKRSAEARKLQGKPKFTVGEADEDGGMRSTVIHELTHALGMQPHINSPAKLLGKLKALDAAGKLNVEGASGTGMMGAWIRRNISTYAATNIHETDAELAALVTSPHYIRGTLPKVLEDHVDELFHRRP